MRSKAYSVALGGLLAALAVVLMAMGTLIPVATYVCPMFCCLLLQLVGKIAGARMAWAWYGAVAVLSLLLAPDKEAAGVFLAVGYYPILKPRLDRKKAPWLWKGLLYNCAIGLLYWVLLKLVGLDSLVSEFEGIGAAMTAVLLVLGNVTFFLLDHLLGRNLRRR